MADEKHILLIEDDRETASTLIGVLEREGYNVRHAPNGVEGQRLLQAGVPDLVITDMMMPKMGGFPVLEFIKSLEEKPQVIMITANEGGRHKAYAEMLGVVNYLRKPFAMDVMLDAVRRAFAASEESASKATPKKKAGPIKRSGAKAKKKAN
jgi:DNA-binding response OmpR family regulator